MHFWSIWNEPDYGPSLAPQGLPGNLTVEHSPWMYRDLLDAAWTALHQTNHAYDTVLFGEVAPRGYPNPENPRLPFGVFNGMKPLVVAASAVLRRSELPPTARRRSRDPGLPGDGGWIARVPQHASGAVQLDGIRRPPVLALVSAERRAAPRS